MSNSAHPIVLTMGDPSGIGPDITLDAYLKRRELALPNFAILADPQVLRDRAALLGLDVPIKEIGNEEIAGVFDDALPVIPLRNAAPASPGQPSALAAAAIVEAIDRAACMTFCGVARAMVTNPIAKSVLYGEGFAFPGHTEFLAARASDMSGRLITPVMMLAGPKLKAVPVTIHIALSDVPKALTSALIVETVKITADDMNTRFGLERPRIAISGLNPHAGESGTMGREEIEIIGPAIFDLRALGLDVTGPLPADTMFHDAARARYDVAVCMYHDQALVPAKALGFDDTVNVTLGLPFVRTSPDHGTAFDIAGKGIARADSLIAAIRMADEMSSRRA